MQLAIAWVLKFGQDNRVPRAGVDFYMSNMKRWMDESREALAKMIRSVDPSLTSCDEILTA